MCPTLVMPIPLSVMVIVPVSLSVVTVMFPDQAAACWLASSPVTPSNFRSGDWVSWVYRYFSIASEAFDINSLHSKIKIVGLF